MLSLGRDPSSLQGLVLPTECPMGLPVSLGYPQPGYFVPDYHTLKILLIAAGLMAFPERTQPRGPPDRREKKIGKTCQHAR